MANPYLPNYKGSIYRTVSQGFFWEQGLSCTGGVPMTQQDHASSVIFKLKVWSADVNDLDNWICHGDSFHTRADRDHESDTPWTDGELCAPDVIEKKDGRYYLYAYIFLCQRLRRRERQA